jgi:hypothetical protein
MNLLSSRWIIYAKFPVVQASLERALGIIRNNGWDCTIRTGIGVENEYEFFSSNLGKVGQINISILPEEQTELYVHNPDLPDDEWMVNYIVNNIQLDSISKILQSLIRYYQKQISDGNLNLPSKLLFENVSNQRKISIQQKGRIVEKPLNKIDDQPPWIAYGLDSVSYNLAKDQLNEWRKKILELRLNDFRQIIGIIHRQFNADRLIFQNIDVEALSQSEKKKPGRPRLPDDIWVWEQVNLFSRVK